MGRKLGGLLPKSKKVKVTNTQKLTFGETAYFCLILLPGKIERYQQ